MREKFDSMTDEELIENLRDGDLSVTDYIMNKYKELVRAKAHKMFIIGGENDDLIQEGMIGLFKAVQDYDPGRDTSFHTFADLCISRQIYTAIEASKRKKHQPLNSYVSIYESDSQAGESENYLQGLLSEISGEGPEDILIDEENARRLEEAIYRELSPLERQVFDLKLTGMEYLEIARVLGRDEKSTDNALVRIKTKVKKIINAKD